MGLLLLLLLILLLTLNRWWAKYKKPDQDQNSTDFKNRKRRDNIKSQDRMPTGEDTAMKSEAESMNTELDFFAEIELSN